MRRRIIIPCGHDAGSDGRIVSLHFNEARFAGAACGDGVACLCVRANGVVVDSQQKIASLEPSLLGWRIGFDPSNEAQGHVRAKLFLYMRIALSEHDT